MFGKFYSLLTMVSKKLSRMNLYEMLASEAALYKDSVDRDQKVLNIGSGGQIYQVIKQVCGSVIQVDIDPDRKPDVVADVCSMEMFEDSSIDAVFMMEVLEHVKEPKAALLEIQRVLKPGGKLIMSTPFIFPIHDAPYDFYRFTRYGLDYMLKDYKDVNIFSRNDYIHAVVVLLSRLLMSKGRLNVLIGMAVFIYTLIHYPLLWCLSKITSYEIATTGYFVTAKC